MNSMDFYMEVKKSNICPEKFDEIYAEFGIYQALAGRTLEQLAHVCRQNNIEYQLAFGTLLGAVRDGGQIPWDYDIDVYIKFADKDKLINALKRELDNDYYYTCPENNARCTQTFIRVAPRGVDSEALHVDVFYLIGITDNDEARLKIQDRLLEIIWNRFYKNVELRDEKYKGVIRVLALIKQKFLRRNISNEAEMQEYYELCGRYDILNCDWIVDATMTTQEIKFEKSKMFDLIEWESELGVHPIPRNYDAILKLLYKDYKTYLPLEKRLGEMMNSYKRLHGSCKF